ncbi:hypothetical protein AB6735_22275 [Mucilaginibacter sp. RCC_168]|uniref:hypothetical protein n=1 Tax=Mucilaginibacter sp. RCC_168 TaxID=3239221 RepID=UPI0035249FD2
MAIERKNWFHFLISHLIHYCRLAPPVVLTFRFNLHYIPVYKCYFTIDVRFAFNYACCPSRVIHINAHDRKDAVFTKNPNSRAGLFGQMETVAPRAQKFPVRPA